METERTSGSSLPTVDLQVIPAACASARTIRWIELILLLAVAFGASLYQAVMVLTQSATIVPSDTQRWILGMIHQITALGLCAYILHKQGRSFRQLGLVARWFDPFYGVGIMLLGLIASYATLFSLYRAGLISASERLGHATTIVRMLGSHVSWGAIVYIVINAPFEELIVRAYLLTDLRFLTGSTMIAIFGSAVFQGLYHLYQGWPTAVAATAGFLVFSLFYVWSRRITPIIIAHLLWDLCMVAAYVYWQSHRHH